MKKLNVKPVEELSQFINEGLEGISINTYSK